jgi:hypothetical protein
MVDVTVTAAEVLPGTAQELEGTSGATITAGQVVYLDSTSSTYKLADADDTAATATVKGIALNDASTGQRLKLATGKSGTIDPGFTVTVGSLYVLSGTPGGIAPCADLATGDYVSLIGYGTAADELTLLIENTGVQVP